MDLKQEEYIKCYKDKTRKYFIENYLSTFDADDKKEVPFILFPRQIVFLKSLVENNNTIAIKPRQAGITTVTSAWATGQCVFANTKSPETILCIGNKLDISQQLLEKMVIFLDQVPRWMWGNEFYSQDPKSSKNIKSIYKTRNKDKIELFNGCKIYARSSGENAARGISAVSILIFDEAAFIEKGSSVYSQAVAATASVSNAKIIMVSTPNGKDQLYYKTYSKALKGENNYFPVEFKWFQDPRYNRNLRWYKKNENTGNIEWNYDTVIDNRGNIKYDENRWRQLEKDNWTPDSPWYNAMCKTFNNIEQKIAQELNVSFLGSSDNVIPVDVIEAHSRQNVIKITDDSQFHDKFFKDTWIWEQPIPGHRYICAVDTSSGASEDRTAIEMIDSDAIDEDGKHYYNQVLEYYGKMTGDEIGTIVYNYGMAYNKALVVIEAIGGYGDSAILTLMNMKYPNLYWDDPGLKNYTAELAYSKFGKRSDGKLPGFRTSSLRIQMVANFVGLLKDNTFRVRSQRTINEMETWVWKNARPDHMDGCHDDSLLSLSMGLFVLQFSMIKHENDIKKDTSILGAWFVNKGNETGFTKNIHEKYEINNNIKMPFYTRSSIEKEKNSKLLAMIMIGGYKI